MIQNSPTKFRNSFHAILESVPFCFATLRIMAAPASSTEDDGLVEYDVLRTPLANRTETVIEYLLRNDRSMVHQMMTLPPNAMFEYTNAILAKKNTTTQEEQRGGLYEIVILRCADAATVPEIRSAVSITLVEDLVAPRLNARAFALAESYQYGFVEPAKANPLSPDATDDTKLYTDECRNIFVMNVTTIRNRVRTLFPARESVARNPLLQLQLSDSTARMHDIYMPCFFFDRNHGLIPVGLYLAVIPRDRMTPHLVGSNGREYTQGACIIRVTNIAMTKVYKGIVIGTPNNLLRDAFSHGVIHGVKMIPTVVTEQGKRTAALREPTRADMIKRQQFSNISESVVILETFGSNGHSDLLIDGNIMENERANDLWVQNFFSRPHIPANTLDDEMMTELLERPECTTYRVHGGSRRIQPCALPVRKLCVPMDVIMLGDERSMTRPDRQWAIHMAMKCFIKDTRGGEPYDLRTIRVPPMDL